MEGRWIIENPGIVAGLIAIAIFSFLYLLFKALPGHQERMYSIASISLCAFSIYLLAIMPPHPMYSSQITYPLIGLIAGFSMIQRRNMARIQTKVAALEKRLTDRQSL